MSDRADPSLEALLGGFKPYAALDDDQEEAVWAEGNRVVQAGAGSGKTAVLSLRYLRLLCQAREGGRRLGVEDILCLTFTRKAAAEMGERIRAYLSSFLDGLRAAGNDGDGLAAHLEAQLASFTRASISTLDAFAGALARQRAPAYGLPPDMAVDDAALGRLAESDALAFILARRGDPAAAALIAANGFLGTVRELLAPLALRECRPSRPSSMEAMHATQGAALEEELRLSVKAMEEAAAAIRATAPDARSSVKAWQDAAALALPDPFSGGEEERAFLDRCADIAAIRGVSGSIAGLEALLVREAAMALKEAAGGAAAYAGDLASHPFRLPAYRLIDDFLSVHAASKRRAGLVCFRDVAAMAVDALKDDPDFRLHYKKRYKAIMVDEFQDNDELQKELLYLLAEEDGRMEAGLPSPAWLRRDKLFFVGDAKQSVYRFRGADVAVFKGLSAELPPARGSEVSLALGRNYRSEPGLVEAFNGLFSPLLGEGRLPFEAPFAPIAPRPATPGIEGRAVLLEAGAPESDGALTAKEAEAWGLAAYLKDAIEGGAILVADRAEGRARKARYEDVAILFRSSSHQLVFERYLRLLSVPYRADAVCGLYSEAPLNDFYAALKLALDPGDRAAYAAYLRSPFAGLSDESLVRLLLAPGPAFPEGGAGLVEAADVKAYARAAALREVLARKADRESLFDMVAYLQYEGGYRAAILARPSAQAFLGIFDWIAALAADADARGRSLAAFLLEIEPELGKGDKLEGPEAQVEEGGGVVLMTVHRSKGLEFPIVAIPNLEGGGRAESAGGAFYASTRYGIVINLGSEGRPAKKKSALWLACKEEEDAKALAEIKRLLYVACTRAESRLVLSRSARKRSDAGTSFSSMIETSFPAFASERISLPGRSLADYLALTREATASGEAETSRLAGDIIAARDMERAASSPTMAVSAVQAALREPHFERPPSCDGAGAATAPLMDEAAFGSLVHALIARSLEPGRKIEGSIMAALPEAEGDKAVVMREAEALAATFLSSSLGVMARSLPPERRMTELAFLSRSADGAPVLLSGAMDLLLDGPQGAIVVDFKTDRLEAPEDYLFQLSHYRRAAIDILEKPARAFLFYLRSAIVYEEVDGAMIPFGPGGIA